MVVRTPLILIGSLALFGCASQPGVAPVIDLAPAYAGTALDDGGLRAAPLDEAWWRAFDDPVLNRLVDAALLGNLDIEAAAARLQQAAGVARVVTSNSLPSATVGASASTQRQSLDDPMARIASAFPDYDRTNSLYGLSAAASWELDVFGRLAAARRAAGADQAAAAADIDGARLSVAAEIAIAYITARELQARIAIAQSRVETSERLQGLVALRFDEGSASRFERDQADADLSASRATLPLVEAALDATFNRIDLLSGRAPGHAAALLGTGHIPAALTVAVEDGPAALLVRRPDIVAAERRLAAADARVAEAVTAYYPRLTVQGLVGFLSSGLSGLISDDTLQAAGSAGLSGRLFDFGAARGGVETARGRTREAAAGYRATVLRAAAEAEDGFSRLARGNRHALELAQSQAALFRANETARTAYELGGSSLKDALDVQRRLLDLEDTTVTARAEASRASVGLFRVLGGGWSADPVRQVATPDCPATVRQGDVRCTA
jgi:NodT family efflux transporter outer membrane factor (OMF) lipoprotein